jgi:serine/threonine protein kinase
MNPFNYTHKPLPTGYILDAYQFQRVLGSPGAFGITYFALQQRGNRRVAIKELFPADFTIRRGKDQVVAQSNSDEALFTEAKKMFRREAEILSRVKHQNVVTVLDYFEANHTGYMVMQYEDGYDLRHHLATQKPGRLNENELRNLLMPLLDGLEAVHELNYLHRDIKPANIYLTSSHKPLLLDFGAARQIVISRSRPVEQILTPPFGAFEQYGQTLPQGPYTDIYALGVTLFFAMLADHKFPDAPDRLAKDPFVPLQKRLHNQEFSAKFLAAVDWALAFKAEHRPQTVAAWRENLAPTKNRRQSPLPKPVKISRLRPIYITIAAVIGVALLILGIVVLLQQLT